VPEEPHYFAVAGGTGRDFRVRQVSAVLVDDCNFGGIGMGTDASDDNSSVVVMMENTFLTRRLGWVRAGGRTDRTVMGLGGIQAP
jgi:hypothetical protein